MKRLLGSLILLFALLGCNVADAAGCTGTGNCYWVGGTGNSNSTANWATTDGGAITGGLPTAADNCNFTALSNLTAYVFTVNAATNCLSVIVANPATGSPTFAGSSNLTIASNLTLVSGMGWTNTSLLTFSATTTGHTITTAGVTLLNSITFNGVGGGWTNQDNLTTANTSTITLTRGAWHLNAKTISAGIISYSGAQARTFDANGATLNVVGFNNTVGTPVSVWVGDTTTLLTSDFTNSIITCSGRNAQFRGGALTFNDLTISGGDANVMTGNNTFHNLTYTIANAGSLMNDLFTLPASITVTGTFTVNGGTPEIRARIGGTGTAITTITAAATSLANVDWYNTTAAGAASPFTGTSMGDMGGDTNINMDAPRDVYWVGNSGLQSDSAHWSLASGGTPGANMPIPQDTAHVDANSVTLAGQTLTFDEPRVSALNFTGVLNNPIWDWGVNPIYTGSLILSANMSVVGDAHNITFQNIAAGQIITLNTNGVALPGLVQIQNFSTLAGAEWQLGSDISIQQAIFRQGTFRDNGYSITARDAISSSFSVTRSIIKTGAWTVNAASGTFWNFATTTGLTWSDTGSLLLNGAAPSGTRTFAGGGLAYAVFRWDNESSVQGLTITGANTFTSFTVDTSGSPRTLTWPASAINSFSSIILNGGTTAGELLSVISSSGGTPATLSDASGSNLWTYVSVKDITASGGATFTACQSTNVSGNTGITFGGSGCNGAGGSSMLLLGVGGWLLERDLNPAANDNSPAYLARAA